MNGKILKISSNDLYGNVDDRKIAVFAAFNHVKYMNKYAIFTYEEEFDKHKLYYGSLHLKNNSLVIFSVNETTKKYIDTFIEGYLTSTLNPAEYQIIDISNIEKAELVSFNEKDFDKLNELDKLSIARIVPNASESTTNKKNIFLYFLLIIMILLLGGITYLYLFPEKFTTELNQLECHAQLHNESINMKYESTKIYKFNKENIVKAINVTDTYTFTNSNDYLEFKNNNQESEYFHINGQYKYNDDNLTLQLFYEEDSIIDNFEELKSYMKSEGYICQEGKYYE